MPSHLTTLLARLFLLPPLLALGAGAMAQERRVPASPNEVRLSYAPIVQRVVPAVVNVYAGHMVANRNPLLDDPIFRRFFGGAGRARGGEQMQRSLGSGVLVDAAGLVVTNNHVIEGADRGEGLARPTSASSRPRSCSRTPAPISRCCASRRRASASPPSSSPIPTRCRWAMSCSPSAIRSRVGQTVTHGIVSAVARTQVGISDYQFFIQTDAAINPGNSGGALVDMSGKLVGINTAIFSRSGGSQGIGFAIPANMVRVVVASARNGGTAVKRPWLGAKLQAVTPEIAEGLNLKRPTGALIANVTPQGPAERAGLKPGDLIVSVDGQAVDDPDAFDYRFATKALGGGAKLAIVRDGRERAVTIALETAPETPRDELVLQGALAVPGRQGVQHFTGAGGRAADRHEERRRHRSRRCERLRGAEPWLPARRHRARGQRSPHYQDP